jgi:hypothetical protein
MSVDVWGFADLTAITGNRALAAEVPIAYQTAFPKQGPVARMVYRGTDGHVWELNSPGPGFQWGLNDLTEIWGGQPAAETPIVYTTDFAGQGHTVRMVYMGTDRHIWELNYLGPDTQWGANDLTKITGGQSAFLAPIAYTTQFAGQGPAARLVYMGTDGNIWELSYLGPGSQWQANELNANGAPPPTESPIAYITNFATQGPTARVVYRGFDDHLYELAYVANDPDPHWVWADLFGPYPAAGGGQPAAETPIAYITNFATQGSIARLAYRGTDDHIWELNYAGPPSQWGINDLTNLNRSAFVRSGY